MSIKRASIALKSKVAGARYFAMINVKNQKIIGLAATLYFS